MEFRSGRCSNDMFCSLASGGHAVRVPVDGNFVCPQCSKPLVAAEERQRRSPLVVGALAGGGMAVVGSVLFAAGTFMGSGSGTAAQLPPAHAQAADAGARSPVPLQLAMTEVRSIPKPTAPVVVSDVPGAPTPAPVVAAPTAPSAAANTPKVAMPGLAVQVSVGEHQFTPWSNAASIKPALLDSAVAARQVVAPPAPETAPARPGALSAEAQSAAKAMAAEQRHQQLAAKADAARQEREATEKRITDARVAAAAAERARTVQQPAPQPQRVAMVQPAQAAAPLHASTGANHPFAAVAIAGGAPEYPELYDEANRIGHVTVNCRIERDGSPHNCQVVNTQGGVAFGKSVMKWLASGRVRYQPVVRDGAPVAATQQWNVSFSQ
jgi:hypothetical protein